MRSLSQTECQFGKLSFFNNAAYRGSLCKLFSSGSTSRCGQTVITLRVSAVQPLERFVGLVPESINLGDLVRTICVVLRNQLPQCGVRLFFPTNRVLMRAAYSALASL